MGLYHAEEEREKEKPICELRLRVREKFAEEIAEVLHEELDNRPERDSLTSVTVIHYYTKRQVKLSTNFEIFFDHWLLLEFLNRDRVLRLDHIDH